MSTVDEKYLEQEYLSVEGLPSELHIDHKNICNLILDTV